MSFGAMAAWQAWILIVAAAGLAAWFFFLKLRPPRIPIASLTLWRRVLDEKREMTWWERVRRAVSLAVILIATVALALAVVRPTPGAAAASAGAASGGRVLVVLDSSWSMLAQTSSGGTRWNRAVSRARALAAAAGGDEIAVATTADGLVEGPTSDLSLIEAALDRISPSGGEVSTWPRISDARAVHFITDGAVGRELESSVVVDSVWESAPNVAITAFAVRPTSQPGAVGLAYLEVANYSTTAQQVRIVVSRGAASVLDVKVDLAPNNAAQRLIPLARAGDPRLRARVTASNNALVVDDEAVAWIAGAAPVAVTVVSDQPAPFKVLLDRDPSVRVTVVPTGAYRPGVEEVVIFDRWLPAERPSRPALCIAPPATPWLGSPGADEKQPRWTSISDHPVLLGVDPLTMTIERARPYDAEGFAPIASSEKGTPIVAVADAPDRRMVLMTFGLGDSNLMFAPAFPVLIGNAIDWLAHPASGRARKPGVAILENSIARVTSPDGGSVPLARAGGATIAILRLTGLYRVEAAGARSVVPVNAGDPETSNLARTHLADSARALGAGADRSGRPWWPLFAMAAFVLLAGEWWTWHRRITV